MPVIATLVDPKALVVVVVEGAMAPASLVQLYILADKIVNADAVFEPLR